MTGLIERAKELAYRAHDGVKRKHSDSPYIVHPAAVAAEVAKRGGSEVEIAAAWLHDVIEDCESFVPELRETMPSEVIKLVEELTHTSKKLHPELNRAARKELDREHVAKASREAKRIKLIDRYDNLKTITDDPKKDFVEMYYYESLALLNVLLGTDKELEAMYFNELKRVRRHLDEVAL